MFKKYNIILAASIVAVAGLVGVSALFAQARTEFTSAVGGFHITSPLQAQPETATDWGLFGNADNPGVDIVAGGEGFRFIPASGEAFPEAVARLDTSGNLTLTGSLTADNLFAASSSFTTVTATKGIFDSVGTSLVSLSDDIVFGLSESDNEKGSPGLIYDETQNRWLLRGDNEFFSPITTEATDSVGGGGAKSTESEVEAFVFDSDNSGSIGTLDFVDFSTSANPAHSEGRIFYDSDDKAFAFYNDEVASTLQIGQESWMRVRNETGSTITNGQAVYVNGNHSSSGLPTVALARADDISTADSVGLATHDIEHNSFGYITTFGTVRDVDTSSFSDGDIAYLSATSTGALNPTRPSNPNFVIPLGVVTNADASSGRIHVNLNVRSKGLFQAGSLLFAGSDGEADEDSDNLKWDNTGKKLGVKRNDPGNTVEIEGALCVDDTDNSCPDDGTAGTIYAESTTISEIDLAENYPSTQQLQAGDLVALDKNNSEHVVRAGEDDIPVGVVSTKPAIVLGGVAKEGEYPVALAGRVPLRISTQNGNIAIGDYITVSQKNGVGAKADSPGYVVGRALEEYTNMGEEGKIVVFIKPQWYLPEDYTKPGFWKKLANLYKKSYLRVKNLATSLITTDKIHVKDPHGITVHDTETGEPHCMVVTNGVVQAIKGEC